jgi:hypothetical protein
MKKRKKNPNNNINYTEWQTTMQLWDSESNRFWSRSNIFTLINGIFLSLLVTKFDSYLIVCIGAIFGLLFSYYWLWVNRLGTWYVKRWNQIILYLEKKYQNGKLDSFHKLIENDKIENKFTKYTVDSFHKLRSIDKPYREKSSTNYMGKVIKLFMSGYVILFIFSSIMLINDLQNYTIYFTKEFDLSIANANKQIASNRELQISESRKSKIIVKVNLPTNILNDSIFNESEVIDVFVSNGFNEKNIYLDYKVMDRKIIETLFYEKKYKNLWKPQITEELSY